MTVQCLADALTGVNVISSSEIKYIGGLLGLTDSLVTQRRARIMESVGFHIYHNPRCMPLVSTDKRRWFVDGESVNLYVRDTVQDRAAAVRAYIAERNAGRIDRRTTRHGYAPDRAQRIVALLHGIADISADTLQHRLRSAGIEPFKRTQSMTEFMERHGYRAEVHDWGKGAYTTYHRKVA